VVLQYCTSEITLLVIVMAEGLLQSIVHTSITFLELFSCGFLLPYIIGVLFDWMAGKSADGDVIICYVWPDQLKPGIVTHLIKEFNALLKFQSKHIHNVIYFPKSTFSKFCGHIHLH